MMFDSVDSESSESEYDLIQPLPPLTQWETVYNRCGLKVDYIPLIDKYFIGDWQASLPFPMVVLFIIISSYLVFCFVEFPYPHFNWIHFVALTIFMCFYIFSYISTICEGPGYLPFYYPLKAPKTSDGSPDYLSGVTTLQEQVEYVKIQPKLPRAGYFKSARRIVLRPDHFCDWLQSFVGKKNHKLFFLFNLYGILYVGTFLAYSVITIVKVIHAQVVPVSHFVFLVLYTVFAASFFILQSIFVCQSIYEFSVNTTQIEDMKNISKTKRGCLSNWEEVFGSRKRFYLWLCPIGAFHGVDPYELVYASENHKFL